MARRGPNNTRGRDLIPAYRHRFEPDASELGYGTLIVERYWGADEAKERCLSGPSYGFCFGVRRMQARECETLMRDLSKILVVNEGL